MVYHCSFSLTTSFYFSIGGGLLLVAGLYSVLWGKEKENQEIRDNDQKQEHKEEVLIV